MPTISTKFTLDGEKAYKAAISEINSGLKVLKSEMNLVSEQYRNNGESMEALTAKADVLERQYLTQADKVDTLRKALDRAAKEYGEADKRTQQWRVSLNNEQAQLLKLEQQMKDNTKAIEEYGDAQEEVQENTTGLGDVIQSLADKAGIQLPQGLTKAANGMGSVNTAAVGVAAGIGAAIAAIVKIEKALIDMTTEAAAAAKQLQLLSSATNLSVESAQEWDYVLGTLGSSLEEAQGDLSALQEKMMDAAAGTGEGAELFGKLGISVTDTSGKLKDTDTVLRELVETMQLMDDETERNAISSALLGGTGEKLTALYDQEAGALDDLIDKKRELGIASQAEVRELAKVSEAMLDLEEATDAAKTKVSAEFAPFLTDALEDISELVVDLGQAATDSGLATTFGSMLSSASSLLQVLGTMAAPVLKAFNELLQPIAKVMALIADSATVLGGIFSLDLDMIKTGLGMNMSSGQLSNQQKLEFADSLQTSVWDPELGAWVGNYGRNAPGTDNWRGGWTWVGENGPELMRLPQGSQVMNNQESRDYGGDTYNITIDAKSVKEDYPNSNFAVPALVSEAGIHVLTKFDIPESVKGKEITDVKVWAYAYVKWGYSYGSLDYDVYTNIERIYDGWDESTVTYNTMPNISGIYVYPLSSSGTTGYDWIYTGSIGTKTLVRIMENGVAFGSYSFQSFYTFNSDYPPYLEISYIDPTVYLTDLSPQSGYAAKNAPTVFSWRVAGENYVYGGVEQQSGTLQWRAGTSGTINSISVGTAQQYTIPSGTFTSDEIQWRVSVTASGVTQTSAWYTLSTVEALPTTKPVSPVSGFVDSTKPITFSWDHVIETGTTQTGFELQASTDGSVFASVAAETTANEFVTIPAGTFAPGPLYWRVRTYNTDGNPGEWSAVAQVTAIGAPNAPVVTLDDTSPRPSVRWQASGQQAYEVTVDGVSVARAFGTAKTYRSETYLTDGQHTISVRVQNQYGLWSEWGTVSVQIANTAGSAITLTAAGGGSASLSWSTDGVYDKYYVYRDGELLARTTATSYDDALTNGAHIYQVRGAYDASGDYGLSNAVNVVIQLESTNIAAVDGTVSIDLPYSETNKRQTTTSVQRQMSTLYFAGSPLPSMEISEWTDRKMTISAALKAGESLTQTMSLVGKLVCARDQYGNCVIGPLPGWTVRSYEMYTTLQTTIQDVNWREAIKHDPIT